VVPRTYIDEAVHLGSNGCCRNTCFFADGFVFVAAHFACARKSDACETPSVTYRNGEVSIETKGELDAEKSNNPLSSVYVLDTKDDFLAWY
jgi:hypothetical protein